jgi:translation elongation factor EF-G
MDRTGANFYRCVEMIEKQLETKPMLLQLPIGKFSYAFYTIRLQMYEFNLRQEFILNSLLYSR